MADEEKVDINKKNLRFSTQHSCLDYTTQKNVEMSLKRCDVSKNKTNPLKTHQQSKVDTRTPLDFK